MNGGRSISMQIDCSLIELFKELGLGIGTLIGVVIVVSFMCYAVVALASAAALARSFTAGTSALVERRCAWDTFVRNADSAWRLVVTAVGEHFDTLYFDKIGAKGKLLRGITLHFGKHAIGITDSTGNDISESGCALSAGQDLHGYIYFFLHPFTSELHPTPEDDHTPNLLLLWRFEHPERANARVLRRYGIYFLYLAHATSAFGHPTLWQAAVLAFLHWRSALLAMSWRNRMLHVGSISIAVFNAVKEGFH